MHSYFFVRKDLSLQDQIVQLQHVSLELGNCLSRRETLGLNFVTCHVTDEDAFYDLINLCKDNEIEFIFYRDSYFDETITALATFPIPEERRLVFRQEKLLRI